MSSAKVKRNKDERVQGLEGERIVKERRFSIGNLPAERGYSQTLDDRLPQLKDVP